MSAKIYEVTRIPDLTLSKYNAFDENSIAGVVKKHSALLRQIHREALLSNQIVHWIFDYDPLRKKGKRLKILIKFDGESKNSYFDTFITNSPISAYFDIKPVNLIPRDIKFKHMAVLIKREKNLQSERSENGAFYSVSKWEVNEEARLYNLLNLLKNVNQLCVYCVDFKAVDRTNTIEAPEILGNIMKRLQSMQAFKVETRPGSTSFTKDERADYVLESYKNLVKSVSENPHFFVNVKAYSNSMEYSGMLLDAAASEALEEGAHDIKTFSGEFSLEAIMSSEPKEICDAKHIPEGLKFWTTFFTLKELVPFVTLPVLYPGESIEFPKETAPIHDESGLYLGQDDNKYDVYVSLENLCKHVFIAGVPGSGKTNSMMHIATQLHSAKIPFLILEPAKHEYRALLNMPGMQDILILSPSSGTKFPLHINPFQFPLGMSLAEHIRNLLTAFDGAFNLVPPMPFLLDQAVEKVYRAKNWLPFMINHGNLEYPTMQELYNTLEEILENTDYESEIKGNLKSFLQVRIGSLLTREMGEVFNVPFSTFEPEEWLNVPIVIELEAMGNGPANFLTLILLTLIRETLRISPVTHKDFPRHVIFLEEAHNLIGPISDADVNPDSNSRAKIAATAFIVKMLAEVRALNEAMIIADQLPTAMAPEVLKNTSMKIGHKLTAQDERALLGSTMSADDVQLERMALFPRGKALAVYEDLLKPFELKIHKWALDNKDEMYIPPNNEELFEKLYGDSCELFRNSLEKSFIINSTMFQAKWEKLKLKREYFSLEEAEMKNYWAKSNRLLEYKKKIDNPENDTETLIAIDKLMNEEAEILRPIQDFIQGKYEALLWEYMEAYLQFRAYLQRLNVFGEVNEILRQHEKEMQNFSDYMIKLGFQADNLWEKFYSIRNYE